MNKKKLINKQKKFNLFYNTILIIILICDGIYTLNYLFNGYIKDLILAILYTILFGIVAIYHFLGNKEYDRKIKEEEIKNI